MNNINTIYINKHFLNSLCMQSIRFPVEVQFFSRSGRVQQNISCFSILICSWWSNYQTCQTATEWEFHQLLGRIRTLSGSWKYWDPLLHWTCYNLKLTFSLQSLHAANQTFRLNQLFCIITTGVPFLSSLWVTDNNTTKIKHTGKKIKLFCFILLSMSLWLRFDPVKTFKPFHSIWPVWWCQQKSLQLL